MPTTEVARQTRDQVVAHAAGGGTGQPTVFDLIRRQRDAIEMALPKHLDTDRFTRIALTCIRTTPKLAECDAMSLIGALMVSAQLGLEPGGPLGQAYLVPRWNNKTKTNDAQFQLGYKGIIELARRSGQLVSIEAHEVCENDEFSYSYGLDDHLTHKPLLRGDRGRPYAYYAIAKFKDGGHAFVVLSLEDIERRKSRSSSQKNGEFYGAWVTDYDAMARKTCIRALAPYLPLSPELERAIRADERTYRTIEPELVDVPALPAGDDQEDGGPADVVEPEAEGASA
jgi:recombination protein RecT